MIANKGDIARFTILHTQYEGVVGFCDEEDLRIEFSTGVVLSFKQQDNNWLYEEEIASFTFLAPHSDEITGTKFHQEGSQQFTTQRLADIQILIQCDHETFVALSSVNRSLYTLSKDKFYENEIYKARVEVHHSKYFTEVAEVVKVSVQNKKALTWRQIYNALQNINLDITNLTDHYVTNLNWVTDKNLDLLKLYDAIQKPETRLYLTCEHFSFEYNKTWRYFVESYPISMTDTIVNTFNIQRFLNYSSLDLLELFYNKNWEILNITRKYNLCRVLIKRLSVDPDERISVSEIPKSLLSKLTAQEQKRLIIAERTFEIARLA
jgi:hypothetical protein